MVGAGGAGTDVGVEVVLANCTRDNVISTAAVEPRIANTQLLALAAAASVSLREGRHAEAVASLAPKCLGSAAGIDRACHVRALGLLKVRQQRLKQHASSLRTSLFRWRFIQCDHH